MNAILDPINRFIDTMVDSQAEFEKIKLEIDVKDRKVASCVEKLQQGVADIVSMELETDDEDQRELYNKARETLQKLLTAVSDDIQRDRKGTEFIKRYEQSFNVAVFGKVKAGKSYLGNFVMGNQIRDLGLKTSYDKLPRPVVEVHDRGEVRTEARLAEMPGDKEEGFFVDPNEATSSIQLFRLGALTWFDTPGIGSVTWENEMLAKDYVENADLVVYTSNSDAAGTRQDFAEMKELYNKGKQFLLLLTQSDTTEEDVDDETGETFAELVAKSEKDRRDTETYMLEELKKQGIPQLKKGELLTISAKLAMTALAEGDEARFQDSHMGDFLNVLTGVTKTDGARLKRETPSKRIDAAIKSYLNRLDKAVAEFSQYQKDLQAMQKAVSARGGLLLESMKQQCRSQVAAFIRERALEIEKTGEPLTAEELGNLISKEIQAVFARTCESGFGEQFISDYTNTLRIKGAGDLEMKKDTINYQITVVRRVSRDPEGFFEHVGAFFGKEYHTSKISQEDRQSHIDLGVNEQQIISVTNGQLDKLFSTEVPKLMTAISGRYLEDVTRLLTASVECLQSARGELETLKKCRP